MILGSEAVSQKVREVSGPRDMMKREMIVRKTIFTWSFTNIGLDVEKGPHTVDLTLEVHGRHVRRV